MFLWLSEKVVSFSTSLEGRTENQLLNIKRAVEIWNTQLLRSGQIISFNKIIGDRTPERGFVSAPTIFMGGVKSTIGGGICQFSSTLYVACLKAGLKILERHPHTFKVVSVPPGLDATVSDFKDLIFQNPYEFDIKVKAKIVGSRLIVEVHGKKELKTWSIVRRKKGFRWEVWRVRDGIWEFVSSDSYISEPAIESE